MNASYKDAKTQLMRVGNENIAYRRLGDERKPVLLFLNHLAATLDNCDPAIMDGFAKSYSVIAIDYRGVGKSTGKPRRTIEEMADDVINFVEAMNLSNIRLLGFSLGGFVAQQVLLKAPNLCVKAILAGTGGAGGKGISRVGLVTYWDMLRGLFTFRDPKYYLFFPMIAEGKTAARDFLKRIKRRTECDDPIRLYAFQAQLSAISLWGKRSQDDLSKVHIPVWVVNGDSDRMVPTLNSYDLAKRIPGAQLTIYPNAGHGGIFQYHILFVKEGLKFLK